eukprot:14181.XXX_460642_460752_1 [CDS] Oithona nana genome sequencing.
MWILDNILTRVLVPDTSGLCFKIISTIFALKRSVAI